MSSPSLKCPACSATDLSPEVAHACFENHARFKYMGKMGTFKRSDLTMGGERARFCLECGYMLLFARMENIEQLRKALKE